MPRRPRSRFWRRRRLPGKAVDWLKPKPVPFPTSLVVKNGLNTRGRPPAETQCRCRLSAPRQTRHSTPPPCSCRVTTGFALMVSAARRHRVARVKREIQQRELELVRVDFTTGPPPHARPDIDIAAQRATEHVLDLRQPRGEGDHGGRWSAGAKKRELPREAFAARLRIGDGVEQRRFLLPADWRRSAPPCR